MININDIPYSLNTCTKNTIFHKNLFTKNKKWLSNKSFMMPHLPAQESAKINAVNSLALIIIV